MVTGDKANDLSEIAQVALCIVKNLEVAASMERTGQPTTHTHINVAYNTCLRVKKELEGMINGS